MRATLARADGFTLVEMLITCVLMLVVLGATLTALSSFQTNSKRNEQQNEAQQEARQGMDLLTRDLRNTASPTTFVPDAVDLHAADEVIFQSEGKTKPAVTSNALNTRRMRYCLADDGVLWRQVQTWTSVVPPAVPGDSACPGTGWDTRLPIVSGVVNGARPIFTYNAAVADEITEVSSNLFVDANPETPPSEVSLQSSVFLRNQNRVPSAAFSVALQGTQVLLNGSESADPEEKPLTYTWYDAATDEPLQPSADGIVLSFTPPAAGTYSFYLVVSDGTLEAMTPSQSICVPGVGVKC